MLQSRQFPETRLSLLSRLREDGPGQSAWREFFDRYAPAVFRVSRLRGLNEQDADDLVQQVMLAVSEHIKRFEYDRDRGRFRQWVRTIAERKIADHYRRARPTVSQDTAILESKADDRPTPEELWEQEWQLQDMLWCLDQVSADISPRRMEAFRMYVLDGLSAHEIAGQLSMSEGHVYVTRYHVLGQLRKRMAALERDL